MAFRRWICGNLAHKHGVKALWTESEQSARRAVSITKQGKTLDELLVSDLEWPERVMEQRAKK